MIYCFSCYTHIYVQFLNVMCRLRERALNCFLFILHGTRAMQLILQNRLCATNSTLLALFQSSRSLHFCTTQNLFIPLKALIYTANYFYICAIIRITWTQMGERFVRHLFNTGIFPILQELTVERTAYAPLIYIPCSS